MGFYVREKKSPSMYSKLIILGIVIFLIYPTNFAFAQEDDEVVILYTKSGKMVIEFFPEDAPNHVDNFKKLVDNRTYYQTIFHRVIKDFMIQGGDPLTKPKAYESPTQWGSGNPGYTISAEFNDIKHNRGIVSMARQTHPDSAGSQFFIVHKDSNFLDGQYTVFGRIITQESYDTLDKIADLEIASNDIPKNWGETEIVDTEIVKRSEIPDLLDLDEPERIETQTPQLFEREYSNEQLEFSLTFPADWEIEEPTKTHPSVPDVIAIGPRGDDFNPTISVSVSDSNGKSLEERIAGLKNDLKIVIDAGQMEILSEEKTIIQGNNAYIINTKGIFVTESGAFNVIFKEVTIEKAGKFYSLTYANSENDFEKDEKLFEDSLNSFNLLSQEVPSNVNDTTPEGGGCLIATATFGTELAPQVQQLREIRDSTLLQTNSGTAFMIGFSQFYYSFSPTIADLERENAVFKEAVKLAITPMILSLSILNYVEIDSEEEMLGYGISVILLNIGMYFVAPAILFLKLRKTY